MSKTLAFVEIIYFIYCFLIVEADDLVWSKNAKNFISININVKRKSVDSVSERSKILENYKFQGELIKLAYYQEDSLIDFPKDETSVSGLCGDIWTIIAEYLNFTLLPVKVHKGIYGHQIQNGSYNGLLGLLERREIHVVPRVNFFLKHANIMDYTVPLWKNRFQLYIRPEFKANNSWIFQLFSFDAWLVVMVMMIIFSMLGIICGKINRKLYDKKHYWSFQEYFFYTFSTICSQGWVPKNLEEECKILELSKRIFSWFVLITVSSHLVSYMTHTKMEPPFKDVASLLNSTNYKILIFNGSLAYEAVQHEVVKYPKYRKRFIDMGSSNKMKQTVCWSKKKYAMVGSDDKQAASGSKGCLLVKTGTPLYTTWATNGIVKGFKYKRAFDRAMIRLHEIGVLDGLKRYWMQSHFTHYQQQQTAESIEFYHVYILFMFWLSGYILSVIICIIEIIVFPYSRNYVQKKKLIKFQRRLKAQSFLITRNKLRHLRKF